MQCPSCGLDNPEGTQCCSVCGVSLNSPGPFRPQGASTELTMVSFPGAIKLGFERYFDFRGRSTRAEFWWWALFELIAGTSGTLGGLFELAVLIPGLAVGVRRLHDVNKSGWWQLIIITIVGLIPMFYWLYFKKGDQSENNYGTVDIRHQNGND